MNKIILSLLTFASLTFADITGRVKDSTGSNISVSFQGKSYLVTNGSFDIQNPASIKGVSETSHASWKEFGKSIQFFGNNSSEYSVDVYSLNGRKIGDNLSFKNGVANIPEGSFQSSFFKLKKNGVSVNFSARVEDTTLNTPLYIVVNGDTLQEERVTSWNSILPTNYIVQRNVAVNIPKAFDKDSVIVGYFNTNKNPSYYYSVVLGRYNPTNYSGFIYIAYDSVSYVHQSYLYSLVSVVKNSNDSVVAISNVVDTILGNTGNVGFDSSSFTPGSSLIQGDSLISPWWALSKNDSSVTLYQNNVKYLDSTITWKDSLSFSDTTGQYQKNDSTPASNPIVYAKSYRDTTFKINDTTFNVHLDSIIVKVNGGTSNDSGVIRSPNNNGLVKYTFNSSDTIIELKIPESWLTKTGTSGYYDNTLGKWVVTNSLFEIMSAVNYYTKESVYFAYKITKNFYH